MRLLLMTVVVIAVANAFSVGSSSSRSSSRSLVMAKKLLLIQNKGGGHGEIGYQLCKALMADKDVDITMVQDDAAKMDELPFSLYGELEAQGVKIVSSSLADRSLDAGGIGPQSFDYVVDNWSKSEDDFNFVKGLLTEPAVLQQYLFVSSAGMYAPSEGVQPHLETDAVKADNGPRTVELACEASGLPYTFMRPQYIYGPAMHKRYLDYFLGRAARNLPIPLPMSGEQLVCLTHSEDVADLICLAIGHPAATNQVFNCGSDRFVGYKVLGDLAHQAQGSAPEAARYMYYEPKDFDAWGKSDPSFPFPRETYVTSVDKAKKVLGWAGPKRTVTEDMHWLTRDYATDGAAAQQWTASELKCDLEILASKDHNFMFTYAFFDDDAINPETMPYNFQSAT
jgi:hypothetical protein